MPPTRFLHFAIIIAIYAVIGPVTSAPAAQPAEKWLRLTSENFDMLSIREHRNSKADCECKDCQDMFQ